MGKLRELWTGLNAWVKRLDSQLVLYRAYFLLGSVSLMLIVILLLNVRVQEQRIEITKIVTEKETVQVAVEHLQTRIVDGEIACAQSCETSVAIALTDVARQQQPVTPTPLQTATATGTFMAPTPSTPSTPSPSATASTIPSLTPSVTASASPTLLPTMTYTPLPTASPTPVTPEPDPSPEPEPEPDPPPSLHAITPNTMVRQEGSGQLTVVIDGENFRPGLSANLGGVSITVLQVDGERIVGEIPQSMPVGFYNLVVTNPDGQSDRLPNAFTVTAVVGGNNTTLETASLVTAGGDNPQTGARENVQFLFFDMPATVPEPVYLHIVDPDVSGSGPENDRPGPNGVYESQFTFTVWGGPGAYTSPQVRSAAPPAGLIDAGTVITSATFFPGQPLPGGQTIHTFALQPAQEAEAVEGRLVYRLAVEGSGIDDLNLYNVTVSDSPSDPASAVTGTRFFAFAWSFVLRSDERPNLYPYVYSTDIRFVQHNCNARSGGTLFTNTPERQIADALVSNTNAGLLCAASPYDLLSGEAEINWTVDFSNVVVTGLETINFWATNQDDMPLALFTRFGLNAPP